MGDWRDIAEEFGRAAAMLVRSDCPRSAASRAYYSFFAALTAALNKRKVQMGHGTNPRHLDIPRHIRADLGLSYAQRKELAALASNLYDRRLNADYNGRYAVDEAVARESLRNMASARAILRRLP